MATKAASSSAEVVTIDIKPFVMPVAMLLTAMIIGVSMIISANTLARGGVVLGGGTTAVASSSSTSSAAADAGTGTPEFSTLTANIDGDPVLGNLDTARVAIIEFSDYECPFCQSFRNETFDQIKQNFIDTGDAVLVYRDLPLDQNCNSGMSFQLHPTACIRAYAAECVASKADAATYYKYHDLLFENQTTITGKDKLVELASGIGVDIKGCLDSEQFKDEVLADISEANSLGISGTPGFVIGTIGADGKVTGDYISGAYPYDTFEQTISKYL